MDLIVTSPPYFALRDYGYAGQIGSEATPAEWLEALWACTAEWVRVLKPEGSLFVNLGDKYNAYNGGRGEGTLQRNEIRQAVGRGHGLDVKDARPKSLLGLPWRYAIGCTDQLGLILRSEIVWAKPNGLPESVTDRVRRAHEQVFHFTRQPRYYAAVDEIREPQAQPWRSTGRLENRGTESIHYQGVGFAGVTPREYNPLGKLPGSVWEIPSAPLQVPARLGVDHFAAFPPGLVRPLVLGWSPPGVCTACGQGRRPVVDVSYIDAGGAGNEKYDRRFAPAPVAGLGTRKPQEMAYGRANASRAIAGYACACPQPDAPARPAVVLDPFGGTGTTALVASAYGRHGITVDLSADYCRLAAWRVNDPGERARARAMPKPPPVPDGQETLFTIAEGYSPIFCR